MSSTTNNLPAEPSPSGWGKDRLTNIIDEARHNIFATFVNHKDWFSFLSELTCLFEQALSASLVVNEADNYIAAFLVRAYACYLAAVRLSASGQLTDSSMLSRGCLENALYAFYIRRNPQLINVWMKRHDSKEDEKKVKEEFQIGKIRKLLKSENPKIDEFVKELYDKTIDLGGHPNVWSIVLNLEEDKHKTLMKIFNTDPFLMRVHFFKNARAGLCSLSIFRLIYPEQFDELKIPQKLFKLYNRMNQLGQQFEANRKDEVHT